MTAGEIQDVVTQGRRRKLHCPAGNDGARARERPRVVRCEIRIRVDDGDVVGLRAQNRGCDLPMRSDRSVPHLGRADGKMIAAVGQQRHLRPRAVLGRRAAFHHRQCNAGALRPVISFGFGSATLRRQGVLDEVEALIEPITAEIDIGGIFPYRLDPIARPDHVLAANLERVDSE